MRPPQNAGEDHDGPRRRGHGEPASMRPPQNAGEDTRCRCSARNARCCFNEAPAERGGRRPALRPRHFPAAVASMRPPQNAGEDTDGARRPSHPKFGLQ